MRHTISLLTAAMLLFVFSCGDITVVKLTTATKELRQGETSALEASVKNNNRAVPTTPVSWKAVPAGAGVLPNSTSTNATGTAANTYTAGAVSQDTEVVITARSNASVEDKDTIMVRPPIVFTDYGGTAAGLTLANAELKIAPSIVETSTSEYDLKYKIESNFPMQKVSVVFLNPVSITKPLGGTSLNGDRVWTFNIALANAVTIEGTASDCTAGGTASWTVVQSTTTVPPAIIDIANVSSVGTKP